MKPTYGAVSRYGLIAFASSLDQIGPLTRSVYDCAMLLRRIVGHDPLRLYARRWRCPARWSLPTAERLDGLRFGIPTEYVAAGIKPGVLAPLRVALVEELGATCVEISLPHTEYALPAYYIIAPAEASANLARFDGVRYGYRAGARRRPGLDVRSHSRRRLWPRGEAPRHDRHLRSVVGLLRRLLRAGSEGARASCGATSTPPSPRST